MTTTAARDLSTLEEQLHKAKSNLKGLNYEIRRIIGRPTEDERDR